MSLLNEILNYNERFVEEKQYEECITTNLPDKWIVILTCMDTRLLELLPKAMNFKNGDVKIVKSAGAVINHPFGGIMRSLFTLAGRSGSGMRIISVRSAMAVSTFWG